jgi:hypothetical protein
MSATDKIKEMLDLPTVVGSREARRLALRGELKDGTVVKGDLLLGYTKAKVLPEDLVVEGNLDISGTVIQLPLSIKVKRNVVLNSGITVKGKLIENLFGFGLDLAAIRSKFGLKSK